MLTFSGSSATMCTQSQGGATDSCDERGTQSMTVLFTVRRGP